LIATPAATGLRELAKMTGIGVDIGGTYIRAARITADGEILEWVNAPTPDNPQQVTSLIATLIKPLIDPHVTAIGVGIPGRVDVKNERVLSGGYVDLTGHSLAQTLRDLLGLPVHIDNDGNMALVAEIALGSARRAETAVLFTIGTGIGGAVFTDGKMLRGRAAAGQLGHLTVDGKGVLCLCGRRGCIETMSSGTALGRHIAAAGLSADTTVEELLESSAQGDVVTTDVLSQWAAPMRTAIDTTVASFDPDIVVLGGGLGMAMHRALAAFPAEAEWYSCPVVPASLGDHAGVVGAGLCGLQSRA
jgi:glucokinase